MSCNFQEDLDGERRKLDGLKKGIYITFAYFAVEFIASCLTNSLAMVGDSFHMFADGLVLTLTYGAYKLRSFPPRNSVVGYLSFGFRRLELLIIILNTATVGAAIFWIIKESYQRLRFGHVEVLAWPVFLVGILGFAVNLTVFRTLNIHSHEEEGIKSAIACALTDTLSPVALVVGSVAILVNQRLFWADTVTALMIVCMLAWSFRKTPLIILNMAMEAAPMDIDFEKVRALIGRVYGVDDILDMHINRVGSGLVVATLQVYIKNHPDHDLIQNSVRTQLWQEFPELKNAHITVETKCR